MMIGTVYGEFATFAPAAYDKNKLTAEEILEILKRFMETMPKRFWTPSKKHIRRRTA